VTQTQILHRDLSASIDDGALLARLVLDNALRFLVEAQSYEPEEVRSIVDSMLRELTPAPPALYLVSSR